MLLSSFITKAAKDIVCVFILYLSYSMQRAVVVVVMLRQSSMVCTFVHQHLNIMLGAA